jgi:hypothetical protein
MSLRYQSIFRPPHDLIRVKTTIQIGSQLFIMSTFPLSTDDPVDTRANGTASVIGENPNPRCFGSKVWFCLPDILLPDTCYLISRVFMPYPSSLQVCSCTMEPFLFWTSQRLEAPSWYYSVSFFHTQRLFISRLCNSWCFPSLVNGHSYPRSLYLHLEEIENNVWDRNSVLGMSNRFTLTTYQL